VAIPRSLKAVAISWTYTLRPPLAFWPGEAVGEVCMDMTAIRLGTRSEIRRVSSATVCRSRVEPASRDADKAGTRDRQATAHNRLNLRGIAVFPYEPGAGRWI